MSADREIDWDEARRQIAEDGTVGGEGSVRSEEEQRREWRHRIEELARETEAGAAPEELMEVVEFELADERYAFEIAYVRSVSVLKTLTRVPCTPSFVAGIVTVGGEIRTVLDLRELFDLPGAAVRDSRKLVLIENADYQLGIMADAVRGVRSVPLADLQPALPIPTGVRADYLRGVTPDRLAVLDAGKLLADERLVVYEEVPS